MSVNIDCCHMTNDLNLQSVSPRHTAIQPPGQTARSLPAGAIHQFSGGSNQYLSSAQVTSIKTVITTNSL